MIELYHRTSQQKAQSILTRCFRAGTETSATGHETMQDFSAIWLSDKPHETSSELPALLRVRLDRTEPELSEYQWVDGGIAHREWLIPTAVITAYGTVELVTDQPAQERRPPVNGGPSTLGGVILDL